MLIKMKNTKPKILILEDNYEMRTFLKLYYDKHFNIISATNISDAIYELEHHTDIVIIITDINLNLGEVTGYDFIEYIKNTELYKNTPIIVLSAKDESDFKLKAFKLGASDYVIKPFNPTELFYRINNLLPDKVIV